MTGPRRAQNAFADVARGTRRAAQVGQWVMGFRRQLFIGYSASLAIAVLAISLSMVALRASANDERDLAHQYVEKLVRVERLRFAAEHVVAMASDYIADHDASVRQRLDDATKQLDARIDDLQATHLSDESARDVLSVSVAAHAGVDRMSGSLRNAQSLGNLRALATRERSSFEKALASARARRIRACVMVGLLGGLGLAVSALLATVLIRRLARQHASQQLAISSARRAAAARDEMLAIVSHDLRNPLATIVTAAHLLADDAADPDTRRHVEIVRFAAERMAHLVDQIVDTAQIDAGRTRLALSRCDVGELLHVLVDQLADTASGSSLTLRCESSLEPAFATADRQRIAQVVSNLVVNALKFTPAGGTVTLRARTCSDVIEVSVEDSGCGISGDELDHVFDRYWRGKRPAASRGLGLGLYICKWLVEAHRGRIWVESPPGQGACFRFTLPRVLGPVARPSAPGHEPVALGDPEAHEQN